MSKEAMDGVREKWRLINEGCPCEHPCHTGHEHTQRVTGCPACGWCHDDAYVPFTNGELKSLVRALLVETRRDENRLARNAMEPNEAKGVPYVPSFDLYTSHRNQELEAELSHTPSNSDIGKEQV